MFVTTVVTYDNMWNVCWQVLQYSKGGHYQVACAKMFELIHGSLTGGEEEAEVSFQHPNQYFDESYKRLHKNLGKLFHLHKNLGKLFRLHKNLGKLFYLHKNLGKLFHLHKNLGKLLSLIHISEPTRPP